MIGARRVRRSFGTWLVSVFLLSIMLPVLILSTFFAVYFQRMYARETDSLLTNTLYSISQSIGTYVSDLARLSMMPYFHTEIMDYFNDMNQGRYKTDPVATTRINIDYQRAISQQLSNVRQDVKGVLFAPCNEALNVAFLVRRYSGELTVVEDYDTQLEDWYQGALAADGRLYFPPVGEPEYYETLGNSNFYTGEEYSMFSVTRLIKNLDTMRPIGVIKIDAMNTVIVNLFRHITISENSALALVDQENHIIYTVGGIAQEVIDGIGPETEQVRAGESTYSVSSYEVASTPWRLLYLESEQDLLAQTRGIYIAVIISGLISLCIAAFLFYLNSHSAVRAENQILTAMKRLAAGDMDAHLALPANSYYAAIGASFNQTVDKLNEHITSEYKATLNQRNAEYIALQAQVNPHFLYNILSSFITLNRIGEREKLEQLLLELSHLFRYTCSQESTSTVEAELTFLAEYLELQKLRFAQRLCYRITCCPESGDVVIPRLLLQPLVENAIVHGLEPINRPVQIEVFADIIPLKDGTSRLLLCVWDDAEGFDMRKKAGGRIGLSNVEERLALFNPASVFVLHSSPGCGCRCVILLPVARS